MVFHRNDFYQKTTKQLHFYYTILASCLVIKMKYSCNSDEIHALYFCTGKTKVKHSL